MCWLSRTVYRCRKGKYRELARPAASESCAQEISVEDVPMQAFARQKSRLVRGTVVIHLGSMDDVCAMRLARRTSGIARPEAAFGRPREFQVDATKEWQSVKRPVESRMLRSAGSTAWPRRSRIVKAPVGSSAERAATRGQRADRKSWMRSDEAAQRAVQMEAVVKAPPSVGV